MLELTILQQYQDQKQWRSTNDENFYLCTILGANLHLVNKPNNE